MTDLADPINGTPVAADVVVMDERDQEQLGQSIRRLRATRGLIVRSAELLGAVLGGAAAAGLRELRFSQVPNGSTHALVEAVLKRAFAAALSIPPRPARGASRGLARLLAAASGAVGGFTGFAGFLPDLAFTSVLIMRNIASVARSEGEDLATEDTRRACLEVFAFGSELGTDNAEINYWSARLLFQGQPLVMLFAEIAARFGLQISQKFAMQAIPVVGAAGGALINAVFVDHYVSLAQIHFTMRRLERRYGRGPVRRQALLVAEQFRERRQSVDPLVDSELAPEAMPRTQQPTPSPQPPPPPQPPPAPPIPEVPTPPVPPHSPPQPPQAVIAPG
jgi:hypothetical protein